MATAASGIPTFLLRALVGLAGAGRVAGLLAAGAMLAAPAGEAADPTVVPLAEEADGSAGPDEARLVDLIADAQRLLSLSGYDAGPIDGHMGPRTQRAIRAYQDAARRHGTLEALKGPPPGDQGPRPQLVGGN